METKEVVTLVVGAALGITAVVAGEYLIRKHRRKYVDNVEVPSTTLQED